MEYTLTLWIKIFGRKITLLILTFTVEDGR